jgi:orotate phosphoribosyltransferase-like protein
MLALRQKGYSYSKIGEELNLSKRQVEHVLRRNEKRSVE